MDLITRWIWLLDGFDCSMDLIAQWIWLLDWFHYLKDLIVRRKPEMFMHVYHWVASTKYSRRDELRWTISVEQTARTDEIWDRRRTTAWRVLAGRAVRVGNQGKCALKVFLGSSKATKPLDNPLKKLIRKEEGNKLFGEASSNTKSWKATWKWTSLTKFGSDMKTWWRNEQTMHWISRNSDSFWTLTWTSRKKHQPLSRTSNGQSPTWSFSVSRQISKMIWEETNI